MDRTRLNLRIINPRLRLPTLVNLRQNSSPFLFLSFFSLNFLLTFEFFCLLFNSLLQHSRPRYFSNKFSFLHFQLVISAVVLQLRLLCHRWHTDFTKGTTCKNLNYHATKDNDISWIAFFDFFVVVCILSDIHLLTPTSLILHLSQTHSLPTHIHTSFMNLCQQIGRRCPWVWTRETITNALC